MKKTLLSILFACFITTVSAQDKKPFDDNFKYVPSKIIVKLKDNVDTKTTYNAKGKGISKVNIGQLLGIESKVKSTTILFTEKAILKSVARKKQKRTDYRVPNPGTLKNIFLVDLNSKTENIQEILATLNKNEKVEYAEPDFNYDVNDFTIDSEIIYPKKETTNNAVTPNDPLYSEQTNIAAVKIDKVWDAYGTGDGSQTIAILDTGIDYTHPDLAENIWINEAELNGVEGFDDDGNGYIDDIRGWDFINVDNAPLDDNMHGTHVAGIAGAVGGNGIGIAGAVWNVKLMPIKVFQSNGVGNASTIAEGVTYASENGATILNMSFGSYAESFTLRNALENAYATSVLVASAGNDGVCIGPGPFCAPSYPGAYTFVIGVQDAAGYSNNDQDGPIFSKYDNLLNYETTAPGTAIMSAVPNGGYRKLTGTSMSSPLLAGGVALCLQQNPDDSKELLFGNLINTAATFVDIEAAITVVPEPELRVLSALVLDTINGQNGNDFIEPNETIEIFPLVKNYWGPTEDVRVGIEFAEFEDQTKATILESEIAIGSISGQTHTFFP
ncbi:S8 family serine peptidase [Polaribacter sp. IC063]|uniref:S8 family serine peptidase n=1 Tax=Polaribacter sp. IC063 TaxID=57031 RepID=UPI0011BF7EF9|nr:S8 family serine peptidase [Polaribacter sp. IC063]TXD49020.1 S8 family serine peptidase [Polaribacter sp. IC063]